MGVNGMGKSNISRNKKHIGVVLADDHRYTRSVIRNYINRASDIEVIGEAANGFEAMELIQTLKPDVLVLDMEMSGLGGVDVLRRLQGHNSKVHIIALSAQDDRQYIRAVLDLGADEYLIKDTPLSNIIDTIRYIAKSKQRPLQPLEAAAIRA